MRNRSLSTAWLCLAVALCPTMALAGSAPAGVQLPALLPTSPSQADVEMEWWVIDRGGGVSTADGLVLSGAVANLGDEPFAILRGFDSPAVEESNLPALETVTELSLAPISPNPNRGIAQVSWALPSQARVRVSIHDVQGREVEVLADGDFPPGRHDVEWRGGARGAAAAGVYFVRLQTPQRVLVRRMVVIR